MLSGSAMSHERSVAVTIVHSQGMPEAAQISSMDYWATPTAKTQDWLGHHNLMVEPQALREC